MILYEINFERWIGSNYALTKLEPCGIPILYHLLENKNGTNWLIFMKSLKVKKDFRKCAMPNIQYHYVLRAHVKVLTESVSAAIFLRRQIKCYRPCSVHVTQRKSKTQCPGFSQTCLKSANFHFHK